MLRVKCLCDTAAGRSSRGNWLSGSGIQGRESPTTDRDFTNHTQAALGADHPGRSSDRHTRSRLYEVFSKTNLKYNHSVYIKQTVAESSPNWKRFRPGTKLSRISIFKEQEEEKDPEE